MTQIKGINIRHALNGGEARIGNYLADGVHEKTVYEFMVVCGMVARHVFAEET